MSDNNQKNNKKNPTTSNKQVPVTTSENKKNPMNSSENRPNSK